MAQELDVLVTWQSNIALLDLEKLAPGIYFIHVSAGEDQPVYYSRIIRK